jgi:maltooligosyltrehalose synthase
MIAFVRRRPEAWALVVAPRFAERLPLEDDICVAAGGWRDTAVVLDDVPEGAVLNAFDASPLGIRAGRTRLDAICPRLPLALAWADATTCAQVPLYP